MPIEYVRDLVRKRVEGRRLLVCVGPLVPGMKTAQQLLDFGAARCLVIADGRGTGDLVEDARVEHVLVDVGGDAIMGAIRAYQGVLTAPTQVVREAIERFDPDGVAEVFVASIYPVECVAGRPAIGVREKAWLDLEDKVVIDALWDEAGVVRPPCAIVPARLADLLAAAREIDAGTGTVWCGDAHEGFNGGGSYVRWIRPGDDDGAAQAGAFFEPRCDRVRVMPFLDGIPCSIHGLVLPNGIAAFRPVEMMVFRQPGSSEFRYGGLNTFWDPAPDDRAFMRTVAYRVGAALDRTVGYRGGFTVDGVMTSDGFLPTELNARFGAGMGVIGRACEDLPLEWLDLLLRENAVESLDVAALESTVLEPADATRGGGSWIMLDEQVHDSTDYRVHIGADVRIVPKPNEDDETACDGTLTLGPASSGSLVRFLADPGRTPVGPSLAPRAARVFASADEVLGTSICPIEPAPALRC